MKQFHDQFHVSHLTKQLLLQCNAEKFTNSVYESTVCTMYRQMRFRHNVSVNTEIYSSVFYLTYTNTIKKDKKQLSLLYVSLIREAPIHLNRVVRSAPDVTSDKPEDSRDIFSLHFT